LTRGRKEINAMKRVPPSVRMKEEVDAVLQGEADPDVPAEEP
jgi:hypothetical protein